MSIYEENLRFLKAGFPELLAFLESVPESRCSREAAKNGSPTLLYRLGSTSYYLHSKFNPRREAEKLVAGAKLSAHHIIVLGLGLGYHLEPILKGKKPFSRVLLLEPEPEIFKHSLHTLRWDHLLQRKDFHFVVGTDHLQLLQTLHNYINIMELESLEYIEFPSETRLLAPLFEPLKKSLDDEIKSRVYDLKTRLAESFMLPRNFLKNLPAVLRNRAAAGLKDMFRGRPGFIVSAGPSLDKNLLFLKKLNERGIMIAVDTALKPLLNRGIQPHFTAIGDPSHKNYLHLQGTENRIRHFVAAEACVAHRVFRDFEGKLFSLSVGRPIVRLAESYSEPLGEIPAWGSVISIALELAVHMGLEPIVFVGQDFAYTDGRNHCRGTTWEEKVGETASSLDILQRSEQKSIGGNRKIVEVPDIFGNLTYTSERLSLYKGYLTRTIRKHPEIRFINASDGGILSEIPHMPLYRVLKTFVYGRPPIDTGVLAGLPTLDKKENLHRLITFFSSRREFFNLYHGEVTQRLLELESSAKLPITAAITLLEASETLKGRLYEEQVNGEIVEMWSPSPIYHFLREYKRVEHMPMGEAYFRESINMYKTYFINLIPILADIGRNFEQTEKELKKVVSSQ